MIVEEGRSIQGTYASPSSLEEMGISLKFSTDRTAHAFISSNCFSTYTFELQRDDPAAFYDEPPQDAS